MKSNLGVILKKLRVKRGYTQMKLAEGICDRHTLASYENQTHDIPVKKLFKFISKMNISIEEFYMYINEHTLEDKYKSSNKLYLKYMKNEMVSNEELTFLIEKFTNTDDILFLATYLQLKGAMSKKQNTVKFFKKIENLNINYLKDYLNSIETWGYFEITIFMNCLYIFDTAFISHQLKKVLDKAEFYSQNRKFDRTLLILCINCSILFFESNEFNLVLYFLDIARNASSFSYSLREKFIINYIHMCCEYKLGKIKGESLEKFLKNLKLLGEDDLVAYLEKFFKICSVI